MDFNRAGQRSRTASSKAIASKVVRAEKAEAQPRTLDRFTKAAPTLFPDRSPAERARKREEVLRSKLDKHIAEAKEQITILQSQHAQALANINAQLSHKKTEVRSLRASLRLVKPSIDRRVRPLTGGLSAPTQRKLATELENFLLLNFATTAAQNQALYEHFLRFPNRYTSITAHGLSLAGFQKACSDNPEWVHPIRREVI